MAGIKRPYLHRPHRSTCLLDLPDGVLQAVMLLTELKAAGRLGCTCQRMQSLHAEQFFQRIPALVRTGPPHFEMVPGLSKAPSKGKEAAMSVSMDIAKVFEVLPPDPGLLFDQKAGPFYSGEVTLEVCKTLSHHKLDLVIQHYAQKDHGKAVSLLRAMWPTYEEVEGALRESASDRKYTEKTWIRSVQRVARCCSSHPCYIAVKVNMMGMDKGLVKGLLSAMGDCAIALVLKALDTPAPPSGTTQEWKRIRTSGTRRRLCTFYLLKYRGLRVLVLCKP